MHISIVGWLEIHKFIYAKQLLRETARAFIQSKTGIRDWASLIDQFEISFSSAEAFKKSSKERKRNIY